MSGARGKEIAHGQAMATTPGHVLWGSRAAGHRTIAPCRRRGGKAARRHSPYNQASIWHRCYIVRDPVKYVRAARRNTPAVKLARPQAAEAVAETKQKPATPD